MSETGVVGEPEIEYTFLGIAVTTTSSSKGGTGTGSQAVVDEEKKKRSRRRTGAIARRLIKGVFKFPLCCRPSVHDDDDDDPYAVTEYSHHIPYAPRKVPEAMNQLVAYQKNKPDVRSQHLPHVARKANDESGQLQRKVMPSMFDQYGVFDREFTDGVICNESCRALNFYRLRLHSVC